MESEDLYSQLCAQHKCVVLSSIFLDYIYRGAGAVASAKIHYTYVDKLRKSCVNMKVFLKNNQISYLAISFSRSL